jgi:hypothetical protein
MKCPTCGHETKQGDNFSGTCDIDKKYGVHCANGERPCCIQHLCMHYRKKSPPPDKVREGG